MINIFVEHNRGMVFDSADVLTLRRQYGIIGAMVGGLTDFKQQNEFLGTPLQLCVEEVTLALELGIATPVQLPAVQVVETRQPVLQEAPADDYVSDDESIPDEWRAPVRSTPGWRKALHSTDGILIPESSGGDPVPAEWPHPASLSEEQKYEVFKDLHAKGYKLTSGVKFGGHYLAYQGDPHLHHAAFVVRVIPPDQPLSQVDTAAATRAATGARKHVLLAWPEFTDRWKIMYITASSEPVKNF